MVLAKNDKGEWIEQHDPSNIFRALINEYKAKYHQTERTPPMTTPLVQYLGYLGMGRHSDNVLASRESRKCTRSPTLFQNTTGKTPEYRGL